MFGKTYRKRYELAVQRLGELSVKLSRKERLIETHEVAYQEISECLQNERDENKRLREALEFYADTKKHENENFNAPYSIVAEDRGEIARQALEGDQK